MIVKMSKYVFMVYHKEYDQFLQELRDLGVLHVKEINSIRDDAALQSLLGERKQIGQAIRFCEGLNKGADAAPSAAVPANKEEGLRAAEQLEALQEKKAKLLATKAGLEKDLAYMEVWGDFDYTNIRLLKEAGYELNFFSCPTSHYEPKWGEEYNAFLVNNVQSVTYFVTVTKAGTPIEIDAERAKMPGKSLSELQADYDRLDASLKALDEETKDFAAKHYHLLVETDKLIGFRPDRECPGVGGGLERERVLFPAAGYRRGRERAD